MSKYDAIVLGTGGVGSAALYHLARRGLRVLGVDRFTPPHDRGSSHGQTRIIRQAYFEHPDYVPLLLKTYDLWSELADQVGQQLYHEVGVLQIGRAEGEVVSGVLQAAQQHKLDVETLTAWEIERQWPALRVPEEMVGAFEPTAGYLRVEACVEAHLQAALASGAELQNPVVVHSWQPGPPVSLQTSEGQLTAERLIITAGAWAGPLLSDLNLQLEVRRKSFFWYRPREPHDDVVRDLPCFLYDLPNGVFYGLPPVDQNGVKLAEHSGGQAIDDPLAVDRNVNSSDAERVTRFQREQLIGLADTPCDHSVCLYTMSPDGHFFVDQHPAHPQVLFAAGLSGHGFKFAPVLGQALADLALDGVTDLPIGFLGLR